MMCKPPATCPIDTSNLCFARLTNKSAASRLVAMPGQRWTGHPNGHVGRQKPSDLLTHQWVVGARQNQGLFVPGHRRRSTLRPLPWKWCRCEIPLRWRRPKGCRRRRHLQAMGFKQTVVQPALSRRTGPDEPGCLEDDGWPRGPQWMDDVDDQDSGPARARTSSRHCLTPNCTQQPKPCTRMTTNAGQFGPRIPSGDRGSSPRKACGPCHPRNGWTHGACKTRWPSPPSGLRCLSQRCQWVPGLACKNARSVRVTCPIWSSPIRSHPRPRCTGSPRCWCRRW